MYCSSTMNQFVSYIPLLKGKVRLAKANFMPAVLVIMLVSAEPDSIYSVVFSVCIVRTSFCHTNQENTTWVPNKWYSVMRSSTFSCVFLSFLYTP